MFELDYNITKFKLRTRYPMLSEEDYEDRYHDTWERYLRYGVPEGINPLSAFIVMFRTWHTANAERKRVATASSIVEFYDPEDPAYTAAAYYEDELEDNVLRLYRRIQGSLNEKMKAVFLLSYQGYTIREIRDELYLNQGTVELYKQHVTVLMAREAGMTAQQSRYELKKGVENERAKLAYRKRVLSR